ncbi:MAG: family acetyltransferase [Modestobacter sp.]|nr:family acetyltransferase [Modestobacter sp.]
MIRPPLRTELPRLAEIERAAGEQFRDIGMPEIAEDEPPTPARLQAYLDRDAARVWAGPGEVPVAYLLMDVVDGRIHVEQVSVHPVAARRGLGRALIDAAVDRARARGEDRVTLTTFAEVPWNMPYYQRLGFAVLPVGGQGPELRRLRAHEAGTGLDRWPRVAMARRLRDVAGQPGAARRRPARPVS